MKIVDLSYQRYDNFTLLDRAFSSLPSGIKIVLIGNTISTIPSHAFDGLNNASLDLTDLSIHKIVPLAFSGTSNLTIDLRGNYITTVDPTSFPRGAVQRGSECVDMWETRCSELSESSNSETCNHADSCLDEILLESLDSEASALSACCAFGGGFRTGKSILMEDQSPIRCRVLNSSSDVIVCECSDDGTQRYDIVTSSCISSCLPGERWESVISDAYGNINSDVGQCVPCLAGTYSIGSVDGWVETCSDCGAGEYIGTNGSSTCLECSAGKYTSSVGKLECDVCTAGKYSEFSNEYPIYLRSGLKNSQNI